MPAGVLSRHWFAPVWQERESERAGLAMEMWLLAVFLLWVLIATFYLHGVRSVVQTREERVRRDLATLADAAEDWQHALQSLGLREWREIGVVLERLLEVLKGRRSLRERLQAAGEARVLFREHRDAARRAATSMSIQIGEATERLDRALQHVRLDLARYNAAAADAAFACERFPLSLLARAVALRRHPIIG